MPSKQDENSGRDVPKKEAFKGGEEHSRLRPSLFPGVPPYHVFLPPWVSYNESTCPALQDEEWQFPAQVMPVVRDVVEHAGFKVVKGTLRSDDEKDIIMAGFIWDNLPLPEKTIDAIDFSRLKAGVKINKFPGFSDLNMKDLLWKNFHRMQQKFGRQAFGFHPDTFKLPAERKQLVERMKTEKYSKVYIVKLPNNYCGIGACVIDHPKKIPRKIKEHKENNKKVTKEDPIIVQSYISNPYLINGYKFDFRIYVLVSSVDPLRIYLYKNGLVRFATEKFSLAPEALSNTFIHLTNFALNKKGETPADYPPGCQVNKWTIYELWDWMREHNTDPAPFWEAVKDVTIKTLLCGHENIARMVKDDVGSHYNNFNLLGLDIFIDTDLQPHLLEVNTIPSLFVSNGCKDIDTRLKFPLIAETFNICGHHISTSTATRHKMDIISHHLPEFQGKCLGYEHRLYCKKLSKEEEEKQEKFCKTFQKYKERNRNPENKEEKLINNENNGGVKHSETDESSECESEGAEAEDEEVSEYSYYSDSEEGATKEASEEVMPNLDDVLDDLSPSDVRVLLQSEEELSQVDTFERIFPQAETSIPYLSYMTRTSYYDLLLAAWERRHHSNRETGLKLLRDLVERGVHLVVPESEKRVKVQARSPVRKKSGYSIPHIFRKK